MLNGHAKPLNGARVLLLGVTYKKDIADHRESRRGRGQAARPRRHSQLPRPARPPVAGRRKPVPRQDDLEGALAAADLVILLQPHACYERPSSPAPPAYCSIPAASFRPPWRRRTSRPSDRAGKPDRGPDAAATTTGWNCRAAAISSSGEPCVYGVRRGLIAERRCPVSADE